jgi:hypothetical protein
MPPALLLSGTGVASPAHVGNVEISADITADRPDLVPAMARAYLEAAVVILNRPTSDPEAKLRYQAAAFLLSAKAQMYAPELVSGFTQIAYGGGFLPPASPEAQPKGKPNALANAFSIDGVSPDEVSHKIEELPAEQRDGYRLSVASKYYGKGDLDAAQAIANKIQDATLRDKAINLISFRRGAQALETGNNEMAYEIANKLSLSPERIKLKLGIARALSGKDQFRARAIASDAVKDAGTQLDNIQNLYLMLAAIEILGQIDTVAAAGTLKDTVKAFNALNHDLLDAPPPDPPGVIRFGKQPIIFRTQVKGVSTGSFYEALRPLAAADLQGTTATVLALKEERFLSSGIIALAHTVFSEPARPPKL